MLHSMSNIRHWRAQGPRVEIIVDTILYWAFLMMTEHPNTYRVLKLCAQGLLDFTFSAKQLLLSLGPEYPTLPLLHGWTYLTYITSSLKSELIMLGVMGIFKRMWWCGMIHLQHRYDVGKKGGGFITRASKNYIEIIITRMDSSCIIYFLQAHNNFLNHLAASRSNNLKHIGQIMHLIHVHCEN